MSAGSTTPDAVPAVVELDGVTVQPLDATNASVVASLLGMRGHRHILDIPADPSSIASMLTEIARQPWSLPLAAVRDGECIGVATTALPDVKSLNVNFTALFVEPQESTTALAMLVRHLLWSFPLHRLHAQIPDSDLTREYIDLFRSVGFADEGRLKSHIVMAGHTFDAVALGLLRTDFETWCAENEPRLALVR